MADCHRARHAVQNLLVEHIVDQAEVFMALDDTVFVDRDATRLLSSVLECEQRGMRVMRRTDLVDVLLVYIDTEYAAFFMQLVLHAERRAVCFSHFIFHISPLSEN